MAFSDSIANLGGIPCTVMRALGRPGVVSGVVAAAARTNLSVVALVQPLPRRLLHLLEGERSPALVRVFCDTELLGADATAGTLADQIEHRGIMYEIESAEWFGTHCEATARKVRL